MAAIATDLNTPEAVRARVVNGLIEPVRRVIHATDAAWSAWDAFRQERNEPTARRLEQAHQALRETIDGYIDKARDNVLQDEDAVNRLSVRVRLLEGALGALVAESYEGDSSQPRPALLTAKAVLRPADAGLELWRPGRPDSVLEADGKRRSL